MENIHPIFDTILRKEDKEKLLGQRGIAVWMSGLSGSGKSTLARAFEAEMHKQGILVKLLDGDNLRTGINKNLGFSEEDRTENIRRAAEVTKLFTESGVVTVCSLISPTAEIRAAAKEIIGAENFYEVYINASFEECARRDVKGLYKKALKGEIKNFTGIDDPYEAPFKPEIHLHSDKQSLAEEVQEILSVLRDRGIISK